MVDGTCSVGEEVRDGDSDGIYVHTHVNLDKHRFVFRGDNWLLLLFWKKK